MVPIKTKIANRKNYGSRRSTNTIRYIVLHYTANDGDTAYNNVEYYANNVVKASAHYFVDDTTIYQSVPDNYTAWSVGGKKWSDCGKTGGGTLYGIACNANSISVEMCDTQRNGVIMATETTMANAAELVRYLMDKYGIPITHVIRHFDVNGKHCPAYMMDTAKWAAFKARLTPKAVSTSGYMVRVTAKVLNVRADHSASSAIVTTVKRGEAYTIVAEYNNGGTMWGKLKSGAGWIALAYTQRV